MVYEKGTKVYCCCGQYIVPTKAVANKKLKCPRCNNTLTVEFKFPSITIVKA